ncbi:hypothetical protein [Simkania sp.]|uniref:hypothetical protein n=1 Tax=Simkania sp. TaxID=34094 RepID=UPI003B51F90B
MVHDLPPETIDEEPLIPYIEEAETLKDSIVVDGVEVLETPFSLPTPPDKKATREDLFYLAHVLHESYQSGFAWKDYAIMIQIGLDYLQNCTEMSAEQKREAILTTLNYVIAQTDEPFLPEETFAPLFESLLVPFIDLALEARSGILALEAKKLESVRPPRDGKPTPRRLQEFTKGITNLWQSGYEWDDLAKAARVAILFLMTFEEISPEEMREGVVDILQLLLASATSEELPSDFNEKIFSSFTEAFSDAIIPHKY